MAVFDGDTEPTPPEGLVTVGRYADPVDGQMAKGMLEAAGGGDVSGGGEHQPTDARDVPGEAAGAGRG
jgi:hypothetical protein